MMPTRIHNFGLRLTIRATFSFFNAPLAVEAMVRAHHLKLATLLVDSDDFL